MREDYKIKFKGELSEKSQKLLLRKIYNRYRLILLFSGLIVALLGFIVYKFLNKIIGQYFIVCGVAGCLVIVLSIRLIWRKKEAKSEMPKQIVIADNKIKIYFENNTFGERDLNDVKSVIETEEYYYFKFRFPFDSMYLCQKDLISEGTLEDFERLFDGRLVKKS